MRRREDKQMDPSEMATQTRRMAKEDEDEQPEGTARLASRPGAGGTGLSQSNASGDQPLDSKMAQQAHQPEQGSEGGHAPRSGVAPRLRPQER